MFHTISLVSARNGLGHTRRLINLAGGLILNGAKINLFATTRQLSLLRDEILEVKATSGSFKVFCIEDFGFDTLDEKFFSWSTPEPSSDIIRALTESYVIISDNSTWPQKYNENFYLMGHFTWIQYWNKIERFSTSSLNSIDRDELTKWPKVKKWFQLSDFSWQAPDFIRTKKIPLMRYTSDASMSLSQLKSRNEFLFWKASGTTGRDALMYIPDELKVFSFINRESFFLHNEKLLPLAVIGRPGLGTIRDCLASATPFIPIWSTSDPELTSNVEALSKLGLMTEFWKNLNSESMESPNSLVSLIRDFQPRILEYWTNNSVASNVCAQIILEEVDF